MGPWRHGGWSSNDGGSLGDNPIQLETVGLLSREHRVPFFEYHLKGNGAPKYPEAWVFETGTNQWRQHDSWPPKKVQPKSLFLRAGGRLSGDPPTESGPSDASDEFLSDPAKPVPFIEKIAIGMSPEYMLADQDLPLDVRTCSAYETDVLPEDVTIAGSIRAELFVSTSGRIPMDR